MDIERAIIEALSQLVSRTAAENLLRRAQGNRGPLTPAAWTELIEGPLQRELEQILPMNGLFAPLQKIVKQLKTQAARSKDPTETLQELVPYEYIRLDSPQARFELVLELAKMDDVIGVMLSTPYGWETRLPELGQEFLGILNMVNRLLSLRGNYRVFYTVLREAQLVLRPLGNSWLAIMALNDANLGQLLYRLSRIEADYVETKIEQ